jgi:hypothetical protein
MSVQITGPRPAIERMLERQSVPGAKLRDLHSIKWIEVPEIGPDAEIAIRQEGCQVHHYGRRNNAC